MRIDAILATGRPVLSFEFFPPRTPEGVETLYETVEALKPLEPSFVSVTYGAGGATRDGTLEIATRVKSEHHLETMAHLSCVGETSQGLVEILDRLQAEGIDNVLALRGDPPRGEAEFKRPDGGLDSAAELTAFISKRYEFAIGGACFPEVHPEAPSLEADLAYLKTKVISGASFLITQLFFDNRVYFDFVQAARATGIEVPIIPGVIPIASYAQIGRFCELCAASIPPPLAEAMEALGGDQEAEAELGTAYAARQCEELLAGGAPGIHFYTLNKARATRAVLGALRVARPWERATLTPASAPARRARGPQIDSAALMADANGSFRYRGHRIAYEVHGEGDRALVLIHGLLMNRRMYDHLAPEMAARGNRVITVDLLGHGESDKPADMRIYAMGSLASQAAALVDHLGLQAPVVGGTSLGANVALELAVHHPDSAGALFIEMPVLEDALLGAAMIFTPILVGLRFGKPLLSAASQALQRVPRTNYLLDIGLDWLRRDPDSSRAVLEGILFGGAAPPREERQQIEHPALVIGHPNDPLHPFSDAGMLVEEVPNARLVNANSILEWRLTPGRLDDELAGFLDQVFAEPQQRGARPARAASDLAG